MNIRLIASDLDDTLLDEQSRLTERTLRALDAARSLGCRVAFVSGRMVCAMRDLNSSGEGVSYSKVIAVFRT